MSTQANSQPETVRNQPRPRILIADDEEPLLRLLEMKFSLAGFEVIAARDGQEAWNAACAGAFDLVITDYRMPGMDGLELCRRLLERPETHEVPVIVITSPWCKIGDRLKELANVVALIEKPLTLRQLVATASALVRHETSRRTG